MPEPFWKRKRGLQCSLSAVGMPPCILQINQKLNFPGGTVWESPVSDTLELPPAEGEPRGSWNHTSSAPRGTKNPREVLVGRAIPLWMVPGRLEDDGEKKGTTQGHGTRADVFFRSCLAFPENTNFIIDFCSFVIFITWPALLLRTVTNSTSPGWKGPEPLTLSGWALAGHPQKPQMFCTLFMAMGTPALPSSATSLEKPPVLGRLMEPATLPSFQALPSKASGCNSQRRRSIELKAADAAPEGWDMGSTDHGICDYRKPDKENQISCFRAWADECKGQEGISLPLHSSAQLGQCITGRHKPGIVFPSPFGSPWHKSCV